MENVKSIRQNHWQHKNNDAKNGYFPTDKSIVEMEMSKINFVGISPNTEIPICDLTGGQGDQLFWMYNYIKNENLVPMAYYNEIDKQRFEYCQREYGELPNWNMVSTDLFMLKIRNTEGRRYSENVFAICRNNPPYIWIEGTEGKSKRFEEESILKNSRYIVPGGVMIFEVPIHQLIQHKFMLQRLTYRFEDIHIFKFPKKFDNYKQVVVFAKKKKNDSYDGEIAEQLREMLLEDRVGYLDEHEGFLYNLDERDVRRAKKVTVFRDGRVNDITLSNGFFSCLDTLINKEEKNKVRKEFQRNNKPIIQQLPGHMAVRFAAGDFNGILSGKVLCNGTSVKEEIIEEYEENGVLIQETAEVYKPQVEVVSANGEYILKKH